MAKQATTKTAAKPSDSKTEELVKLEIISEKPVKIGSMNVGKGHKDSLPKSLADALINDGKAVKIYQPNN